MVVLILLGLVLPTTVIALTRGGWNSGQPILAVAVMVLAAIRFSDILWSSRVHPHEMIFWLFTYVFLGMAPLVQIRERVTLETTPNVDRDLYVRAFLVVLVGCLAFIAGAALKSARVARADGGVSPSSAASVVEYSMPKVRLLLLGATAATGFYLLKLGGIGALFMSRFELSDLLEVAFPETFQATIVAAASNMGLLVSFCALVLAMRSRFRGIPMARLDMVLMWVAGAMLLVVVNPISSPRYVFGTVALSFLAVLGALDVPKRFRVISLFAMSAFPILFPILDSFRVETSGGLEKVAPLEAMLSGDFDSFFQIVNGVEYVEAEGAANGRQLLGVLLFAVPRKIWPEKPVDTGILLANFKGYDFTNLSAPLWCEFFVNGGWLFLVLGMFCVGYLLRHLDLECQRSLAIFGHLPLLACILPFYMLILLRGSLLQATANLFIILLSVAFIRRWRRRDDSSLQAV
ncbi:hypothetical protein [Luteococcus sp. OSA5]|uniref:hypothetical protein n=1 Tax=Luteococcus sp. OSA5 TaxID=3401630 RepID=UPI003B429B80